MKRPLTSAPTVVFGTLAFALAFRIIAQQSPASSPLPQAQPSGTAAAKKAPPPPPVNPTPEELAKVKDKTEQIEALVKDLRAKHANAELLGDVEVYAKAGRM